jgi:hypothetical protein
MADKPIFIGTPKEYVASITNSTTAADWIVPTVDYTARAENAGVQNNHSATVTVEIIYHDGTSGVVIKTFSITTATYVNVLEEMFGSSADKQYLLASSGKKYQLRVTTAVAGVIAGIANGGEY